MEGFNWTVLEELEDAEDFVIPSKTKTKTSKVEVHDEDLDFDPPSKKIKVESPIVASPEIGVKFKTLAQANEAISQFEVRTGTKYSAYMKHKNFMSSLPAAIDLD